MPVASRWERSLPFILLALPLGLSLTLLPLRNAINFGDLWHLVANNRVYVSVAVQVISSVLGLLNVFTVTTLINYATRLRLEAGPTSSSSLSLWTAISLLRSDFTMPAGKMATCLAFLAVAQVPGALWAGSLAPKLLQAPKQIGTIEVPNFDAATKHIWDHQFVLQGEDHNQVWNYLGHCQSAHLPPVGFVSTCPVPDYRQLLLDEAGHASAIWDDPKQAGSNPILQNRSKINSPNWIYRGRSFGFGSSLGVAAPKDIPSSFNLLSYSYIEAGYRATIHCDKNASAAFHHFLKLTGDDSEAVWMIQGVLPNSIEPESYPVLSWSWENEDLPSPVLGWAAVSNAGSNFIGVTANERYSVFNRTQCQVDFTPVHMKVLVNQTERVIEVQDTTEKDLDRLSDDPRHELEPTGILTANVMRSIRLLSRMGTALYVSDLGEPLMRNYEREKNARNVDPMTAIGDSFISMIDNLLVAYGAAQVYFAAQHTKQQPIMGTFSAVRLGNNAFIFSVAAMNIALFIATGIEARRTKLWRALPGFDHSKVQDVVLAVDAGWRKQLGEGQTHHHTSTTFQVKLNNSEIEPVLYVYGGKEVKGNSSSSPSTQMARLLTHETENTAVGEEPPIVRDRSSTWPN